MQVWPAFRSLPHAILRAAVSRSAVRSTTQGLLPPSSSVTGVRCAAAFSITVRPKAAPPVKKMWSKRYSSNSAVWAWSPSKTDT